MNLLWNGFVCRPSCAVVCFLWGHLKQISSPRDRSPLLTQIAESSGGNNAIPPSLPSPHSASLLHSQNGIHLCPEGTMFSSAGRGQPSVCHLLPSAGDVCWSLLAAQSQVSCWAVAGTPSWGREPVLCASPSFWEARSWGVLEGRRGEWMCDPSEEKRALQMPAQKKPFLSKRSNTAEAASCKQLSFSSFLDGWM